MRPGHSPSRNLNSFCIKGVLLLAYAFGNVLVHAQGIPNDDSDIQRVDQSHIEVIDLMRATKRLRPAQPKATLTPAPSSVKKTFTAADANEPPPRDPPMCFTPPEIKEKNEARMTLDDSMTSVVTYYLEVREQAPGHKLLLYAAPAPDAKPIGSVETGDIILVEDTPQDYSAKLRADLMGEPIWRKVVAKTTTGHDRKLWFQYTKRWMTTLSLNDLPFEMLMRPPRSPINQPLYREPGFWNADDCKRDRSMCTAYLAEISRIYFIENRFLPVAKDDGATEWWSLFYKLGVYTPEDGLKHQRAAGWIEAHTSVRRVDLGPACIVVPDLAQKREMEKQQADAEVELFALNGNSKDPARRQRLIASLGVADNRLKNITSISDLTLGYKFLAGFDYISLDQPFAGPAYAQDAARLGLGVYSNLFVDLQLMVEGSFTGQLSSTHKDYGSSNLIDLQEWLTYTSPWAVSNQLVKIGVGAYYLSMISSRAVGGFNGFVGPQGEVTFGGQISTLGFRWAPVAQDLSLNLANRILGVKFSHALPWNFYKNPIQFNLEFSNVVYKNSSTGASTNMNDGALSLTFPF
jgi:hypothetical protein